MSQDKARGNAPDPFPVGPREGYAPGWYPLRGDQSMRARAFGEGPAPLMAWWDGEAWDATETTVLFSSATGTHARRHGAVTVLMWFAAFGAAAGTYAALKDSTSVWAIPTVPMVWLLPWIVVWSRRGAPILELTPSTLTFAFAQRPEPVWTVPLSSIVDVRVLHTWPRWCERSRIDVVLVDGGRLVARGVAGADVLHDLLVHHGVISRDRIVG